MKRKRGKKINFNFSDRWLYTLIAIGILLLAGVGVYAYNSGGPPSEFGHSADEIEGGGLDYSSTEGTWNLGPAEKMIIPEGIYHTTFIFEPGPVIQFRHSSHGWVTVFGSTASPDEGDSYGGFVISDGSNYRVFNGDGDDSRKVHYRKLG